MPHEQRFQVRGGKLIAQVQQMRFQVGVELTRYQAGVRVHPQGGKQEQVFNAAVSLLVGLEMNGLHELLDGHKQLSVLLTILVTAWDDVAELQLEGYLMRILGQAVQGPGKKAGFFWAESPRGTNKQFAQNINLRVVGVNRVHGSNGRMGG